MVNAGGATTNGGQTSLSGIQGLADAVNQGGGINLSNLGSNLGLLGNLAGLVGSMTGGLNSGSVNDGQNLGTFNLGSGGQIGQVFGNLLTGLVGNRFSGRKSTGRKSSGRKLSRKKKRSVENNSTLIEDSEVKTENKSRKRNLNTQIINHYELSSNLKIKVENLNPEIPKIIKKKIFIKKYEKKNETKFNREFDSPTVKILPRVLFKKNIEAEDGHSEERILNLPIDLQNSNIIVFPSYGQNLLSHENQPQNFRDTKSIRFESYPKPDEILAYVQIPVYASIFKFPTDEGIRTSKTVQFNQNSEYDDSLDIPVPKPSEYYEKTRMIFPDRTGTGNLKFDNEHFQYDSIYSGSNRFGKILTGGRPDDSNTNNRFQSSSVSFQNKNENNLPSRPSYSIDQYDNQNNNRYTPQNVNRYTHQSYTSSQNNNRYTPQSYTSSQSSNRYTPQYQSSSQINRFTTKRPSDEDTSKNVYVTNSQGVIEYYINKHGEKIRI